LTAPDVTPTFTGHNCSWFVSPVGFFCLQMPPKPRDRSIFGHFNAIQKFLNGNSKPCDQFGTFQMLHDAIGSKNETTKNQAFKCLYDRYLPLAAQLAQQLKIHDEEKAAAALDTVFVTLYQQIGGGKLQLADEGHLKNYVRNGVRNLLIKDWQKRQQMVLVYDDDLSVFLSSEDIHIDSELGHLLINDAVEQAMKALSLECQQKVLLWRDGFNLAEIAKNLGILPSSVKAGLYQCRLKLRAELLKLGITFKGVKPTGKPNTNQDNTDDDELA
jgi:RNA polymerase sigma factor (sigma-70 family)